MNKKIKSIPILIITACLALTSCATASFSKYKGVGRIKRYEIYSEQVPGSFNGFRIAFASDFHYESRFDAKRLHGAIRALQAADADVLLLGGDYRGREGGDMHGQPRTGRKRYLGAPRHGTYGSASAGT